MAWTKKYRNEKQKGEYFRNCLDEKECGGKWWKEGDEALDNLAMDFSKSDDNSALKFNSPRYVPYVNPNERAFDLIKDLAPNVQTVSRDASGRWIYYTKNGDQLAGPLYSYLTGIIGADPRIRDVYDTKSYLTRKNYIASRASTLGSEEAAESEYLQSMASTLKASFQKDEDRVQATKDYLGSKANAIDEYFQKNGASLTYDKDKLQQKADSQEQTTLLSIFQDQAKKSKEAVSKDFPEDRESFRKWVDYAVSTNLLKNDMQRVALEYSLTHSSQEIKEDPYTLASYKNALDMERDRQSNLATLDQITLKWLLDKKDAGYTDPRLDTIMPGQAGNHGIDPDAPLATVQAETIGVVKGDVQTATFDYIKSTYENLKAAMGDTSNPARQDYARKTLETVFKGILDKNLNLRTGIERDPTFQKTAKDIYSKAVALNQNDPNLLLDPRTKSSLLQKQKAINTALEKFTYFDEDVVFNNKQVVQYIKDKYKNEGDFVNQADFLLDETGHQRSQQDFKKALYTKTRHLIDPPGGQYDFEDWNEDSDDMWEYLNDKFTDHYNKNDILNLKNVNLAGYQATGGGGIGGNKVTWWVDGAVPNKTGHLNTMSAKKDFEKATSVVTGSDHSKEELAESDDNAKKLVGLFYDELTARRYKERGIKTPPLAAVSFQPVAADSRNTAGYTVEFDPRWLESITKFSKAKGKLTASGPAAFLWDFSKQDWKDNNISFYLPSSQVESDPGTAVTNPISIWDVKIRKSPIVLEDPSGGSIRIEKSGNDYLRSGFIYGVDNEGKMVKIPLPPMSTPEGGNNLEVMVNASQSVIRDAANRTNESMTLFDYSKGRMPYTELQQKFPEYFK